MRSPFAALLLYLSIPLVIFFATWLTPVAGLPVAAATLGFVIRACMELPTEDRWPSPGRLAFYSLFAAFLALTSGTSPLINGSAELDLAKHRYILQDLITHEWPVLLGAPEQVILRYGLGFYIVPAGLAKLAPALGSSIAIAHLALGLFVTFCAIDRSVGGGRLAIAAAICFAFFSGLDLIYFAINYPNQLLMIGGKEAWARDGSALLIGSNPFNLSWTPQHALAAWMPAVLLYALRDRPGWIVGNAALIVTAVAFWSPFCAVAVLALLVPPAIVNLRAAVSASNIVLGATASLVIAIYLTLDGSAVPASIRERAFDRLRGASMRSRR